MIQLFRIGFVFGIVLFFFSCQKENDKQLMPTIEEDTMASILADIHIAESALQNYRKPERDTLLHTFYHEIFEIHQVESTIFYENQKYYFNDPQRLDKLYEKVDAALKERQRNLSQ